MFDSTDTLSAVSGDGSVREAAVEAPAATFYIGDTPIVRGELVKIVIYPGQIGRRERMSPVSKILVLSPAGRPQCSSLSSHI